MGNNHTRNGNIYIHITYTTNYSLYLYLYSKGASLSKDLMAVGEINSRAVIIVSGYATDTGEHVDLPPLEDER